MIILTVNLYYFYYNIIIQCGNAFEISLINVQVESYLDELYKTTGLNELMQHEERMHREIKALDSDMQTLVYENYNKFISATDTIRKMKDDFRCMEEEMKSLDENMRAITEFSDTINATLADKRHRIKKLSGVHGMLQKMQFLFELPARLNKCLEMGSHAQAVRQVAMSCTPFLKVLFDACLTVLC